MFSKHNIGQVWQYIFTHFQTCSKHLNFINVITSIYLMSIYNIYHHLQVKVTELMFYEFLCRHIIFITVKLYSRLMTVKFKKKKISSQDVVYRSKKNKTNKEIINN